MKKILKPLLLADVESEITVDGGNKSLRRAYKWVKANFTDDVDPTYLLDLLSINGANNMTKNVINLILFEGVQAKSS